MQEFIEAVQVGDEMASLLPAAQANRIRKALLSLGVRVFVIKTVREQRGADTTQLVIVSWKPFQTTET